MAAHARLKNEFTDDEKCHNLMRWLIFQISSILLQSEAEQSDLSFPVTNYRRFEPAHETMALFVLRKLIFQMRMRSYPVGARCLIFGRTLRLLPYFMCANSEFSGETARTRRLA